MAARDITGLMNAYRECSRNLWNVYFSNREDIGGSLDVFEQIRELLFDSLVLSELPEAKGADRPVLNVVPKERALILVRRLSRPGEAGYWDEERDLVVGPTDIALTFIDFFDFSQIPIMDSRYYRCKILNFPSRVNYVGRETLLKVEDARVFHDQQT